MSKIKICGLRRPEDIWAVNRYKPDFIGFIFDDTRRRYITPQKAEELRQSLSPDIQAVGVFVNADRTWIAALAERRIFDIIQLHGQESEADIRWLQEHTNKQVIKAVSVSTKADLLRWQDSRADYLLFDNGAGGTGQTFDWSFIDGWRKPYFLAGGLNAANLDRALSHGAYALDISGGVETDGAKDPAKIAEIMAIAAAYRKEYPLNNK